MKNAAVARLKKRIAELEDDLTIANRIIDKNEKNLQVFRSMISDIRDVIRDSHNKTIAPTYNELHHSLTTILMRAIPRYD